MYLLFGERHEAQVCARGWMTRERLVLYSGTMCVLYAVLLAIWARVTDGFAAPGAARPASDFAVFWAASHIMLHGSPWQVYDHFAFANALKTLFGSFMGSEFLPWLYPPTFLMVVTPLALLPFLMAYFLFVGVSVFSFVGTALRVSGLARCVGGLRTGTLLLATCPCVFVTVVFGQNSLLTAALAALAVQWIDRKPVRAGLCIGLLAIKPQMALLFPFVLVAAGAWRVMAVAAGSAALFGTLSLLVCGTKTLALFMANANMARDLILEHGEHLWLASPTAFAALRVSGLPLIAAYGAQGCVAIVAGVAACSVWRRTHNVPLRAAVLTVATLIANPYVWHYELAWLGIALASMVAMGLQRGWRRGEQEVMVLAWLLPLYELFNRWAKLPQIGVIVLLLMLLMILMRLRTELEESR